MKDQLAASDPAGLYLCDSQTAGVDVVRYWDGEKLCMVAGRTRIRCSDWDCCGNFRGPLVCLDVEAMARELDEFAELILEMEPYIPGDAPFPLRLTPAFCRAMDRAKAVRKQAVPAEQSTEDEDRAAYYEASKRARDERFAAEPAPQASEVESLRREIAELRSKISAAHEALNDAGAYTPEGTHPQLVPRIKLLASMAAGPKLLTEGPLPEGHYIVAVPDTSWGSSSPSYGFIAAKHNTVESEARGRVHDYRLYDLGNPSDWPQPPEAGRKEE